MYADPARLELFFTPRRIAVIGASEQGLYPAGVIRNLLDYGFPGEIYPVNPNRDRVFGLPCYPEVSATPAPADLAVLVVNRKRVLPALRQCIQAGIPAALIFTAGFAEAGAEGTSLQLEMESLAANQALTIVGPNCAGLANVPGRVIATRLPVPPRPGSVSVVSQSGALMMALYGLFSDRHIGVNRLLSLGNQVDVTLGDGLRNFAADAGTRVIAAFVEGVKDGRGFVGGLRQALEAGRPVVLVKSGRTRAGQHAAATHTAAVAGSDRVFQAVCRQFGALLVDDLRELLDTLQVLDAFGSRLGGVGRLALITQSGGMGSLAADWCERAGFSLPPLGSALQEKLVALPHLAGSASSPHAPFGNPADVRGTSLRGPLTGPTLEPFLIDPETDLALLLLARSAVQEADAETAAHIIAAARRFEKPLAVVWVGQRYPLEPGAAPMGHRMLVEAGIPVFDQPGDAIRALKRGQEYWNFYEAYRHHGLEDVRHERTAA